MVYWQKFNPDEFEFELMRLNWRDTRLALMKPLRLFGMVFKSVETSGIMVAIKSSDILTVVANLKLIVYEKRKGLIRVITGWDYDD